MRIFLGTNGLGRYGELIKQGLEENGCRVKLCDDRPHRTKTLTRPDYQIHSLRKELFSHISFGTDIFPAIVPNPTFYKWIERFDVFIFWFADSLAPALLDIPYLYASGKKVIYISAGDDMIFAPFERIRREWRGCKYLDDMTLKLHKRPLDISQLVRNWYTNYYTIERIMYIYRVFEGFGYPLVLCSGAHALARKPFYRWVYRIPYPELVCLGQAKSERNVAYPIKVRHYSSNPTTKDTDRIQRVFENTRLTRLCKKGLLSLQCKPSIPPDILFKSVLEADFIVDQMASFGAMSWEAAALATPAFSGPDFDGFQDPSRDIVTIQVWNDEQLTDRIEHLAHNLYAATSLRKSIYASAKRLTPKTQMKRFIDEVILGIDNSSLIDQAWGNYFLDESIDRLSLRTPLLSGIDKGDISKQMLDAIGVD